MATFTVSPSVAGARLASLQATQLSCSMSEEFGDLLLMLGEDVDERECRPLDDRMGIEDFERGARDARMRRPSRSCILVGESTLDFVPQNRPMNDANIRCWQKWGVPCASYLPPSPNWARPRLPSWRRRFSRESATVRLGQAGEPPRTRCVDAFRPSSARHIGRGAPGFKMLTPRCSTAAPRRRQSR